MVLTHMKTGQMNYKLANATLNDVKILESYKLHSILDYADNISKEEINKIKNYVYETIPSQIKKYKLIIYGDKIIGCLLIYNYDNGVLLDEIYLIDEYRNKGIGSDIIKKLILKNNIIYLWVYKLNTKAIALYKKLGFKIIKKTETRYYMGYMN